jgi:hypothetical protein
MGHPRLLEREDDLVLTSKGKPIAILVGVEDTDFEEMAAVIRQAKALRAVSQMRRQSVRLGLDRLSSSAIDAEIRKVRSRRKRA